MLVQRQYSIWNMVNKFILFVLAFLVILSLFFKWRVYSLENTIKQANSDIVKINNQIKNEKEKGLFRKFEVAKVIQNKENGTNYYGLYSYLNQIKNDIIKILHNNTFNYNRFILKIDKNKIHMSLMLPSFNSLYGGAYKDDKGVTREYNLFDSLNKKTFIKSIRVDSYKVKNNFVYFDMDLTTK